jgi:hypothetical protein
MYMVFDGRCADFFLANIFILCITIDVEICFFSKTAYIKFFWIYIISTCAGIDKYKFHLDFKGVLSSTPQVSVSENWSTTLNTVFRYKSDKALE